MELRTCSNEERETDLFVRKLVIHIEELNAALGQQPIECVCPGFD